MATAPETEPTPDAAGCAFVVGDDGLTQWSDSHSSAWIGLLETHKRLTRALDAEMEATHGLSLSAVEVLGRLAAAGEDRSMKLSALASASGLSLSRISRIVDLLAKRKLVERRPCASDARVVYGQLTPAGLELVREAQRTHFASVQERFFDQLDANEIAVLGDVFSRFAPRAAEACSESD